MRVSIIVCSRANSKRLPGKCFMKIAGMPILHWLLKRLQSTGLEIILAIPAGDRITMGDYGRFAKMTNVILWPNGDYNPMQRMYDVATESETDVIVRICHDKIFVDAGLIKLFVKSFLKLNKTEGIEYLSSSTFMHGSKFEIFTTKVLGRAIAESKNKIEHITYAVRSVTDKVKDLETPKEYRSDIRLLIDYPEDFAEIKRVSERYSLLKKSLPHVINILNDEDEKLKNRLPTVTVYTCAHNAKMWIKDCIKSVLSQKGVNFEYLVIDDGSKTLVGSNIKDPRMTLITYDENKGLAHRSNDALAMAKGEFIIRLDADDYFLNDLVLMNMIAEMKFKKLDASYPDNHFQKGNENHHIGGTMFRTESINALKFNEKLRGYEGYDFFLRAKDVLKIGYFDVATFHYRQHDNSMSKTDLEERAKIKKDIECQQGENTKTSL